LRTAPQRLLTDLKSKLNDEGIPQVEIDEKNGVLRLSERAIRFDPGKSDLDATAQDNVARVARVLSPLIQQYSACTVDTGDQCVNHRGAALETVFIEGHTDTTGAPDPIERDRKNWLLSTDRATMTYRAIVADAPELKNFRNRLNEQIISVSGYSSTRPITPGDDKAAWAKNRRIDLRFVMDAETRFGLDEIRLIRALNAEIREQVERIAKLSQEGVERCK
jgi:flagellar motor protein MotB